MGVSAMETLGKQQIRTRETQARLLDAAEEIFVRDGFESAQLDEIAATAGRSKGTVHTHFKSKEDLFLALFEHRTQSYIENLLRVSEEAHESRAWSPFESSMSQAQ